MSDTEYQFQNELNALDRKMQNEVFDELLITGKTVISVGPDGVKHIPQSEFKREGETSD